MLPPTGPPSPGNCCNVSGYEIRSGPRPAIRPEARAETGKSENLPGLATEYARKSPLARLAALLSPFLGATRSGSPVPARSALPLLPSPVTPRRQIAGLPADTAANPLAGTWVWCARYGIAATNLRSRILRSNLSPLLPSATPAATYNLANLAALAAGPMRPLFPGPHFPSHAPPTCRHLPPIPAPAPSPARLPAPALPFLGRSSRACTAHGWKPRKAVFLLICFAS